MVFTLTAMLGVPQAGRAVPIPSVSGPITGGIHGHALWDSWYRLSDVGYTEAEYFVSGTAKTYKVPSTTAAYTTRIIVTRPVDSAAFNGTVLLDWVNVTAQFENAVDTLEAHPMLLREGYAIVHVSAQSAGICCTPLTPKVWDPQRYAPLSHPGDDYSFDIFSQVAKAVRAHGSGADSMPGLTVQRVLAAGQSQSASRLYDYVRLAQGDAGVIDGFLIHSGGEKSFPSAPAAPVLHLLADSEADAADPTPYATYRLWEVAGAAHSDFWIGYHQEVGQGPRALADAPQQPAAADEDLHEVAGNYGEKVHPMDATCILAGATFPMRYAVSAAIHALNDWVSGSGAPSNSPRYAFDGSGQLLLDAYGNAVGGMRLPPVEWPVATYVSTACALGGITVPFTEAQLNLLYPTHADYFCKMQAAAVASVADKFLLAPDATDLMTRVFRARTRWIDLGTIGCGDVYDVIPTG
jgi:hypothetical protein